MDCSNRDRLFNNIYTISNVSYAMTALVLGILIDKFGFVPARIISGALITTGFTLMVFTEDTPSLIFAAWPLMAAGGVSNHIVNAKMALAIPTIKLSILQGAFRYILHERYNCNFQHYHLHLVPVDLLDCSSISLWIWFQTDAKLILKRAVFSVTT